MQLVLRKYWSMVLLGIFCFTIGCFLSLNLLSIDCVCSSNAPENNLSVGQKPYSPVEYVVLILSKPSNSATRNVIRQTWTKLSSNIILENGEVLYRWNISTHNLTSLPSIKHYFVIGTQSLNKDTITNLQEENSGQNDLLLLDTFQDSYRNLALKILHSLKWLNENHPKLKYLIKCDDDSFVRVDLIVRDLEAFAPEMNAPQIQESVSFKSSHHTINGMYWGYFNGKARVFMQGKWQEEYWFMCDHYLPYAQGGGYVISKNIIDYIAKNVDVLSHYSSEDVSMGVWTAALGGINRVHDTRFDTEWKSKGCQNNMLIRHKQTTEQIIEMYKNLLYSKGEKLCKTEALERAPYRYLWTVAPTKCCSNNIDNL